jgi:hypothetical protein
MPKTQVSCPNCRQPIMAEIDQLFDVNVDPAAKQRFLSGSFNFIQCPVCGYQGTLASPILYHDPDKELLLTYVPPELGLPRNDQERLIGGLINQVIQKLPQEKRKGYLLKPQETLTLQGMVERVLEGEGITREMIQSQQERLNLIRRLAGVADESGRVEIAKQEDKLIDAEFFGILSRLIEAAAASGDQNSARQLSDLQKTIMPVTTYGRKLQEQTQEVQSVIDELRSLGKDVTRDKVLDLILKSPTDTRVSILVSLARPVMDYGFFQLLSERIDRARGDGRTRLVELRTKLLEMTQAVDRQVAARREEARQSIDELLKSKNIEQAIQEAPGDIDEFFVQELNDMLEEARKKGDLERSAGLRQIVEVIQKFSAPPELALIEEYLDVDGDQPRQAFLDAHQEHINQEFLDLLANIAVQTQSGNDPEFAERVQAANRQALRFSMMKKMREA